MWHKSKNLFSAFFKITVCTFQCLITVFIPAHLDISQTYASPGASSQAVISAAHALQHSFVQAQLEACSIKHLPLV